MYQALRTSAGGAGQHYRTVDLTSKIEGASPHRLITILYEELVLALAGLKLAIRRQDGARVNDGQARALSIVQTLDASLDFEKGGEIARALSAVYGETGRLIGAGVRERAPDRIDRAQKLIAEIAEAWSQIG